MKRGELSIGDWVSIITNDGDTFTGLVDSIGMLRDLDMETVVLRVLAPEKESFVDIVIDKIIPIPLTSDLLELNDFWIDHIDQLGQYEMYDGTAKCENIQQVGDHWETSYSGISFKYVHEFQHYLRLTNNDLADEFRIV